MEEEFDLLVLGGGPAGTSGATAAGALGKSVALIERSALLGGAGINTGTIPSKTLRETALMLSGWKSRRLYGVDLSLRGDTTLEDFSWHANNVMSGERARTTARLDLQGVTRFHGSASFVDAHTVRIIADDGSETLVRGEKILIATGSSPARLPGFPFDDDRVHDSDEILALREMPKKLVVIGAGVIGSEYAGTFAALGVEVHVIDGRNKLMPFLDEEIADTLTEAMVANGVKFHWKERVLGCDASQPGDVTLTLSSGSTISCDGVLICSGRQSKHRPTQSQRCRRNARGPRADNGRLQLSNRDRPYLCSRRCHRGASACCHQHRTGAKSYRSCVRCPARRGIRPDFTYWHIHYPRGQLCR